MSNSQLELMKSYFRAVVDTSIDGKLKQDASGFITHVNKLMDSNDKDKSIAIKEIMKKFQTWKYRNNTFYKREGSNHKKAAF